jgi:starch-binding outer membrane protein, SusD/RagB family
MKKLFIKITLLLALSVSHYGCNDMLDLEPQDRVSDASFWKNANDFKLGANVFYTYLRTFTQLGTHGGGDLGNSLGAIEKGINTIPVTDANFNDAYSRIRVINNLLEKAAAYPNQDEIKQYVAEAKFFRAYVYFENLLTVYGASVIIDRTLNPNSSELTSSRNPREEVVDFIIKDLEEAIPDLPLESILGTANKGRVSQGAAQAFLGRVALYEGTWQKFRGGNSERVNALLDKAISNSDAVILSNQYALFAPVTLGDSAQKYLFILEDQKSNPANINKSANREYILAQRYDQNLRQIRLNVSFGGFGSDASKVFADMFLCQDGLPADRSPLFQGYGTMKSEYLNRDNRMKYQFHVDRGYYWSGNANWQINWNWSADDKKNARESPFDPFGNSTTGYNTYRFVAERQVPDNQEGFDYPVIRYAEVLLNYAEAVYERNGSISDADLDKSLNLVRNRVNKNMPKLSNTLVNANGLSMREEIRRERTVELNAEAHRMDDLKRWYIAHIELTKPVLGVKWTGTEFATTYTGEPGKRAKKTPAVDGNGFVLVDAASNRLFSEKHYLLPIPTQQIQLNPKLGQNPGWE